jgi:aryl-alcohol dehydrogenase-like predicted oxidoreductase
MTAGLPLRQLGTTDIQISRVGFGAWAIGGGGWSFAWGPQDDNDSIAAMRHAVERGINWIDTAAVYGLGHSEEVVGRMLAGLGRENRPYIFTKCGMIWSDDRMKDAVRSLAHIRRECEASLRRLGIDRIDLYQFHWPDATGIPVEESWRVMEQLVDEGKVRAIGVSNFDASLLRRIDSVRHVDSLQPPFSLIRREVAAVEIPWCNAHRTGVIAYSPMQSGILTDTFTADKVKQMPSDDWRKRSPNFQTPRLEKNISLRDALRPIAERRNTTVASVAVAWTLAWPGVTGAIVGARSPQQVDGWLDAASLELSPGDLDEIAAAIDRLGVGSGPTRPPSPMRRQSADSDAQIDAR